MAALPAGPQVPAAAALPADAYVVASPCSAAAAAPGTAATAVFTVGASVNPQVFKEVALQVDYPTALYPSAKLTCQTSTAQGKQTHLPTLLTRASFSQHCLSQVRMQSSQHSAAWQQASMRSHLSTYASASSIPPHTLSLLWHPTRPSPCLPPGPPPPPSLPLPTHSHHLRVCPGHRCRAGPVHHGVQRMHAG